MRLDLPTIAHYAREGGFTGHDVTTATALAWVGSGGHTHLDLALNSPGAGRYVGLWALDTTEWRDYEPAALLDPLTAAKVAFALTRRHDGFAWSQVWRAGTHEPYLDRARVAATQHPHDERFPSPIAHVILGAHALRALERLRSRPPTR